ncbi:MAG: type I-D CRISPR-associated helicase Cas3' [Candidatus Tectomicrobia bacterium]|uniref:Type I-D CRISPR-associated helicase Cas3 n=1 Tax=Tectimicrobiota bacterium TaxID=2528274 RepID=A0A932CM68_UNCTE|nr:type I-D CRISPR-associated helicase Cas3' [Candidatus Tectomicrobia bacterium]
MAISIDLLPVDYALKEASWLPGKIPYSHQVRVMELIEEALAHRKMLCIFNTSSTGGGKTLASFAHSILRHRPALGVYPTNELIEDQRRALASEFERGWGGQVLQKVDSRELDRWEWELERHGHPQILERILDWGGVVLTNPDIVYLTFFGLYGSSEHSPGINQRLFQALTEYPVYVFDEFHLYNIKQVGNIATMVGALRALQPGRGKVFVFSSATPHPLFQEAMERLGVRVEVVTAEEAPPSHPQARRVAHPIQLTLLPANLAGWKAFEALQEQFDLVRGFLDFYPGARTVFILDAVADAIRLASLLRKELGAKGVGEVHGLSSDISRRQAFQKPHTVGTSTIEVGIDFVGEAEKDLLVFEAKTAAQFVQRLGRLGRHAKSIPTPNRVLALVPQYVHDFLQEKIKEGEELPRTRLCELILEGYRAVNQFRGYFKRYAPVEAFALDRFISAQMQPDTYEMVRGALDNMIRAMSGREIEGIAREHAWLKGHKLLKPLQSFRGSDFQVAILDRTETEGSPLKTCDLFFVLRRTRFRELSKAEFFRELDEIEKRFPQEIASQRRRLELVGSEIEELMGVYGYFQVEEILEQARKVWLEAYQNRTERIGLGSIRGLIVSTDPPLDRELTWLNRTLGRKSFVCWIGRQSPWTISFSRGLPPMFELYELRIKAAGGRIIARWSIAFNQNAYFLDCLRWEEEERGDKS